MGSDPVFPGSRVLKMARDPVFPVSKLPKPNKKSYAVFRPFKYKTMTIKNIRGRGVVFF